MWSDTFLVAPHIRGGYLHKGDAHPKIADVEAAFSKKEFRGGVKLTFSRAADSKVSDAMLAKGPSSLTNAEVEVWLEDIQSQKYTVNRLDDTLDPKDEPATPHSDLEPIGEKEDRLETVEVWVDDFHSRNSLFGCLR